MRLQKDFGLNVYKMPREQNQLLYRGGSLWYLIRRPFNNKIPQMLLISSQPASWALAPAFCTANLQIYFLKSTLNLKVTSSTKILILKDIFASKDCTTTKGILLPKLFWRTVRKMFVSTFPSIDLYIFRVI